VSEQGLREELAAIAREARRHVERERAAGGGDLLALSVAKAAAVATARGPESAPPPAPRPSDIDLFGAPVAVAKPAATATPLPPLHEPLHPAGRAAREALAADAFPILEQVAGEARVCRKCGLCDTRTNAVPGVGSAKSGIVFVGEAPGADEDRRGEPFVGRAGELLTKMIEAMDVKRLLPGVPLTRETVYICNVLKCRPPENRNPLPHEIEMCSPYLLRQIEALKPRVICCLGKFAAELLLGVKGTIASMRGRTYRYRGAKLIVTYHPAYCLRNPASKHQVWDDLKRLAQEYQTD
jgi:DNA polymerase